MTLLEQESLIKLGESIDIQVLPVVIDGNLGVSFCRLITANAYRAHRDLMLMSLSVCANG